MELSSMTLLLAILQESEESNWRTENKHASVVWELHWFKAHWELVEYSKGYAWKNGLFKPQNG